MLDYKFYTIKASFVKDYFYTIEVVIDVIGARRYILKIYHDNKLLDQLDNFTDITETENYAIEEINIRSRCDEILARIRQGE